MLKSSGKLINQSQCSCTDTVKQHMPAPNPPRPSHAEHLTTEMRETQADMNHTSMTNAPLECTQQSFGTRHFYFQAANSHFYQSSLACSNPQYCSQAIIEASCCKQGQPKQSPTVPPKTLVYKPATSCILVHPRNKRSLPPRPLPPTLQDTPHDTRKPMSSKQATSCILVHPRNKGPHAFKKT